MSSTATATACRKSSERLKKIKRAGMDEYVFVGFDLDMAEFTNVPIKNELLVQNPEDMQDRQRH